MLLISFRNYFSFRGKLDSEWNSMRHEAEAASIDSHKNGNAWQKVAKCGRSSVADGVWVTRVASRPL